MPQQKSFKHLSLVLRKKGAAKMPRGGKTAEQTKVNKSNRSGHSRMLGGAAQNIVSSWKIAFDERSQKQLPPVPKGIPILLQIDPNLDVDMIRHFLGFEIISEQEDGFIVVGTKDLDLQYLIGKINDFSQEIHGSTTVASVYRLFDDPNQIERLRRILSENLFALWPKLEDDPLYVVDVSIACLDSQQIPEYPKRGKRDTDASWEEKKAEWEKIRSEIYEAWEDRKIERENDLFEFTRHYSAKILSMEDSVDEAFITLPDSFTVRLEICGKGLRDLVLNFYPIFEVSEPDDIEQPNLSKWRDHGKEEYPTILPPAENAPAVCVIDSGIQENHFLLEPAIDSQTSRCFIPGKEIDDVKDEVAPSGHGTRVAGAVLYKENIATSGEITLPCWIQNARVLDENNEMLQTMLPPLVMREVIRHFHWGPRKTRIFNQSINTAFPCRTRYMSAWSTEIDLLCHEHDILFIQSVGNIPPTNSPPALGVKEHISSGRDYPKYLSEDISRVANPGQSLQALTVGSISYQAFNGTEWSSFAQRPNFPSAFSRSGFGIWGVVKPDVVEYGGDYLRTHGNPPDISTNPIGDVCYPPLVRSSFHSAVGPAVILMALEGSQVKQATFELPKPEELGDARSCQLLRDALRIGVRNSAGPFRSFGRIAVQPRPYQLVPLMMGLKLDPVRLLIADDVGIGKTIESCLLARELIDRGECQRLCVLCPPHLAEQWQAELREKFHIDAKLVLPSTVKQLETECLQRESVFEVFPYTVVSIDFIKSDRRREDFLRAAPDFVIVDEAHAASNDVNGSSRHQRYDLVRRLCETPNRNDAFTWAFLSNGLKFRILRDNVSLIRAAYVEFDLEAIMEHESFAEFFVFYLLVHQSRVEITEEESPDAPSSGNSRLSCDGSNGTVFARISLPKSFCVIMISPPSSGKANLRCREILRGEPNGPISRWEKPHRRPSCRNVCPARLRPER